MTDREFPTFPDHYCPICLHPVDLYGDHWQPCEYEAYYSGWINPVQPLTRLEMLVQKLDKTNKELDRAKQFQSELNAEIATIKAEIEERKCQN